MCLNTNFKPNFWKIGFFVGILFVVCEGLLILYLFFNVYNCSQDRSDLNNQIVSLTSKIEDYKQEANHLKSSSLYIYTDPYSLFSVAFPYSWFEEVNFEEEIPIGVPSVDIGRSYCKVDEKTVKNCLNETIHVKLIDNPNNKSLEEVYKQQVYDGFKQNDESFSWDMVDLYSGRIEHIVLDRKTAAILVDQTSANNLLRYIYFQKGRQVVEVTLQNVGSEDVEQFVSTFNLL